MADPQTGIELIAAERQRQIDAEGWTPEHDDEHADGELAVAGACYAIPSDRSEVVESATTSLLDGSRVEALWPWEHRWYKRVPYDRVRELVKAGALIAAEIDRLQRSSASSSGRPGGDGDAQMSHHASPEPTAESSILLALNLQCDGCLRDDQGRITISPGCALHGEGLNAKMDLRALVAERDRAVEYVDAAEIGAAKLVVLAIKRGDEYWQEQLQHTFDLTIAEAEALAEDSGRG